MRNFTVIATILAALGIGIPYALDGKWAAFVVCLLAGVLWVFPSRHWRQRPVIGFVTLAILGITGTLFDYPPLWQFNSFVILLIAWDLEHFTRLLKPFANEQALHEKTRTHTAAHLRRLGLVAGTAWILGMIALSVQISTSFSGALLLGLVVFLSLKGIVRLTGSIKLEG